MLINGDLSTLHKHEILRSLLQEKATHGASLACLPVWIFLNEFLCCQQKQCLWQAVILSGFPFPHRPCSALCNPLSCSPAPETLPSIVSLSCAGGKPPMSLAGSKSPFSFLTALLVLVDTITHIHKGLVGQVSSSAWVGCNLCRAVLCGYTCSTWAGTGSVPGRARLQFRNIL